MQLLPTELKLLIVELSSTGSLAALARTHSAYQNVAENALYHTISIYASSNDSLRCLETLAENSEKAAFVRFLTITYDYIDKYQRVTTCLSKSLINMHSLSDFWVKSWHGEAEEMKDLGKIMWSVCEF
jgi:hypothetical protein